MLPADNEALQDGRSRHGENSSRSKRKRHAHSCPPAHTVSETVARSLASVQEASSIIFSGQEFQPSEFQEMENKIHEGMTTMLNGILSIARQANGHACMQTGTPTCKRARLLLRVWFSFLTVLGSIWGHMLRQNNVRCCAGEKYIYINILCICLCL